MRDPNRTDAIKRRLAAGGNSNFKQMRPIPGRTPTPPRSPAVKPTAGLGGNRPVTPPSSPVSRPPTAGFGSRRNTGTPPRSPVSPVVPPRRTSRGLGPRRVEGPLTRPGRRASGPFKDQGIDDKLKSAVRRRLLGR